MNINNIFLLALLLAASNSTIFSKIKDNVLSYIQQASDDSNNDVAVPKSRYYTNNKKQQDRIRDIQSAKRKARVMKRAREFEEDLNAENSIPLSKDNKLQKFGRSQFHMDPVLNSLKRRDFRRKRISSSSASSSSSREMPHWKQEFKKYWIQKKFEAINSTTPKGDIVNMVAARPWGTPCGDPNQHDMPWGTCMLPMECEAEYRIYRGDYFCGRTQFICCSLQLNTYDMYQGFEVSFEDSDMETDSEEKRNRGKGSKERRRRRKRREKKRRKKQRIKRKRKIKRNIRKVVKEIRKILNRAYRNGTTARKKKTQELKKFIKELKKQYKKDRIAVKDVHELELIKIDADLMERLNHIKDLNQEFLRNSTFRDIILNGAMNRMQARMLVETFPELASYVKLRRSGGTDNVDKPLAFDVEYGYLYY